MEKLLFDNTLYNYYEYPSEKEFEKVIISQSANIFGSDSLYVDIKKRIGDSIVTIPDGYLIDFSFQADPRLYIIENELAKHDPYKHIGSQILKFAISYRPAADISKGFYWIISSKTDSSNRSKTNLSIPNIAISTILWKVSFSRSPSPLSSSSTALRKNWTMY